jgi:hypothetical protein
MSYIYPNPSKNLNDPESGRYDLKLTSILLLSGQWHLCSPAPTLPQKAARFGIPVRPEKQADAPGLVTSIHLYRVCRHIIPGCFA